MPTRHARGADYRAAVRGRYEREFRVHERAARLGEAALGAARSIDGPEQMALEMLGLHAYKSHHAVAVLAERGLTEDAATATRRLLELGVQASYIVGESADVAGRAERAGRYVARLWEESPAELRQLLSEAHRARWETWHAQYAPGLQGAQRRWAPRFQDLFRSVGAGALYESQYRYLSGVAHGATEEMVLLFSQPTVEVRSDRYAPVMLLLATLYYAKAVEQWDRVCHVLGPQDEDALLETFREAQDALSSHNAAGDGRSA